MGKKSEERARRIAAARARDSAIIEQGAADPMLVDWLEQSRLQDPGAYRRAKAAVLREARRPSSPTYQQALLSFGGMLQVSLRAADRAVAQRAAESPAG